MKLTSSERIQIKSNAEINMDSPGIKTVFSVQCPVLSEFNEVEFAPFRQPFEKGWLNSLLSPASTKTQKAKLSGAPRNS